MVVERNEENARGLVGGYLRMVRVNENRRE